MNQSPLKGSWLLAPLFLVKKSNARPGFLVLQHRSADAQLLPAFPTEEEHQVPCELIFIASTPYHTYGN